MEIDVKQYNNGEIVLENDINNSIRLIEKITTVKNEYSFDYQKNNELFFKSKKHFF